MILALFALINFISIDRRLSIRLRVRKGEATVTAAIRWRKRRLYILVDTGSSVSVCLIVLQYAVHILTFSIYISGLPVDLATKQILPKIKELGFQPGEAHPRFNFLILCSIVATAAHCLS